MQPVVKNQKKSFIQKNYLNKANSRDAFNSTSFLGAHFLMYNTSKNSSWDQLLKLSTMRK